MKLSGVRLSVRPSVRLSVCLSHHSAAARYCGGFAAVGPAASGYRSIAARPALSSKCEQCHVVKLNTDLLASFCPSLSSVESGNRAVVEARRLSRCNEDLSAVHSGRPSLLTYIGAI